LDVAPGAGVAAWRCRRKMWGDVGSRKDWWIEPAEKGKFQIISDDFRYFR